MAKNPTKSVVFYTDNRLDSDNIGEAVRAQLLKSTGRLGITCVSLKPISFPPLRRGTNYLVEGERGYLTMFRQILAGLEYSSSDIVFLCEHDVLYHPSHFDFVPPRKDMVYYNTNCWHLRAEDGHALYYTAKRVSQLCAYRSVLLEHYRKRVEIVKAAGFTYAMGFEPGTHRRKERVDNLASDVWRSEYPNIDIKHGQNLTPARWSRDKFRNPVQDWQESDTIPGWGYSKGRFSEFLEEAVYANQTNCQG